MANKVIAFGDSFTYGHELSDCPTNDYPTHSNLTYAALVAKHLGREYQCQAMGAYANNAISRRIIESIDSITTEDLVLVMWTNPIRKEFLLEGDLGFRSLSPKDSSDFSKSYYRWLDTTPQYLFQESLKEIYIAQTLLKEKNIKYIFIGSTRDITEPIVNTESNLVNQIDINNWILLDNNLGFMEWAKDVLHLTFGGHPLDSAHQALSKKIIDKLGQI